MSVLLLEGSTHFLPGKTLSAGQQVMEKLSSGAPDGS